MGAFAFLLGIDVGTTLCKAGVIDTAGTEVTVATAPTPWRPVASGAEMDPRSLMQAVMATAADALRQAGDPLVAAIGVTSMAEAGVLLDSRGHPVADCIAWYDERGSCAAEDISTRLGDGLFSATTGLPVSRLCTLAKYRWLRENRPETASGVRWLGVAEWVAHTLGGEQVAELSLASRTGMLDRDAREWWDDALAFAIAPRDLMPSLVTAGVPIGRADGSILTGTRGAVITVGGLDHLAAAVGAGATADGDSFSSCGTAEAIIRTLRAPLSPAAVVAAVGQGIQVGWHVLPQRQMLLAAYRAGLALQRFLTLLGADLIDHSGLDEAALRITDGGDRPRVLGITEERTDVIGLSASSTPGHIWRAALEALAEHSAMVLKQVDGIAGRHERLIATGGWWRSPAYRAVKTAAVGSCDIAAIREAGTRGAALMAGVAAGVLDWNTLSRGPLAPTPSVSKAGLDS